MNDQNVVKMAKNLLIDKKKIVADKADYSIKFVIPGIGKAERKFLNRLYSYVSYTAKRGVKKLIHVMDFPGDNHDVTMLEIRYKDYEECTIGWKRWEQYKNMVFGKN